MPIAEVLTNGQSLQSVIINQEIMYFYDGEKDFRFHSSKVFQVQQVMETPNGYLLVPI